MLEEAVKNDKSNPGDLALGLLQFIQNELPAGGSSAETRFLRMYIPICDRIFGPILDAKDKYKHADGGWMSVSSPSWYRSTSSTSGSGNRIVTSPSLGGSVSSVGSTNARFERDPVAKLLGTASASSKEADPQPTLIEAISKESANRPSVGFPLQFHALPENLQQAWLALLDASLNRLASPPLEKCSTQTQRLLMDLVRRPPMQQEELLTFKQSKVEKKEAVTPLMQLSPRRFPPSSPVATHTPVKDSQKPADPKVIFGMLEYYLFLFMRYPLAVPVPKSSISTTAAGVNTHRISVSRGGTFKRSDTYGERLYSYLFGRYLKHFLPYNVYNGPTDLSRDSELFLHIIISIWLESQGRCQPTSMVVHRRYRDDVSELNLKSSYDLVQVSYDPPYMQVQNCIISLVTHLILDPSVEVQDARSYSLTQSMQILQEPFFNYIRATFRAASIHVSGSPFYSALDTWLKWLEPWNVSITKQGNSLTQNATKHIMRSQSPSSSRNRSTRILRRVSSTTKSYYTPKWEAYVAANLHLYTIPLAIFLRRAREFDFSRDNFHKSLDTVRRVFRVYTPELVNCLNRLLRNEAPEYIQIVSSHTKKLEPYLPPNLSSLSLSSCQKDMTNLLEDIYSEHLKKVTDQNVFWPFIDSFLGSGATSGEEKTLNALLERARIMVQLGDDYRFKTASSEESQSPSLASDRVVQKDSNGRLTDESFQKIFFGETKCSPSDVTYNGDMMKSREGTDEVPILIELFVFLSEYLHQKTGFKVNLRYFANWRNLISSLVISVVASLVFWTWLFS